MCKGTLNRGSEIRLALDAFGVETDGPCGDGQPNPAQILRRTDQFDLADGSQQGDRAGPQQNVVLGQYDTDRHVVFLPGPPCQGRMVAPAASRIPRRQ